MNTAWPKNTIFADPNVPRSVPATRRTRPRSALNRLVDVLSWIAGTLALFLSLSWLGASWAYPLDLLGNLDAQWLLTAIVLSVFWLVTRRWRHAALGLVACLACLPPLLSDRAAFWPCAVPLAHPSAPDAVRIFHFNARTLGDPKMIEALMESDDPDVISVCAPPVRQQMDVIYGHGLEDRFPGKMVRKWKPDADGNYTDVTATFVVSRWPMKPFDTSAAGDSAQYLTAGVVERPAQRSLPANAGYFGVISIHPMSPRTESRWARGNMVTDGVAAVARAMERQGLPVVVVGDLNCTPSGWRNRHLCAEAKLRRGKPLFLLRGTFPRDLAPTQRAVHQTRIPAIWPASIAIDDVLVSSDIAINGWTIGPVQPSEHRPIVVDLDIPFMKSSADGS